jgi:hypothetical protein
MPTGLKVAPTLQPNFPGNGQSTQGEEWEGMNHNFPGAKVLKLFVCNFCFEREQMSLLSVKHQLYCMYL